MAFEVDFLRAGDSNGDAICIRYDTTPGYFGVLVVDGGFADTGDLIIDHLETHYQPRATNRLRINVVASHMDNDHSGGLLKVVRHFPTMNLWMNRPWLYVGRVADAFRRSFTNAGLVRAIRDMNPNLVDLENLAYAQGIPVWSAFQGQRIGPFTVLAPTWERFISLIPEMGRTPEAHRTPALVNALMDVQRSAPIPFNARAQGLRAIPRETWTTETLSENPDPTSASNESSVVMLCNLEGKRVLLTADAGPDALHEAVDYAIINNMRGWLDLVQVPHHGSRHNVTPRVLDRLLGNRVADPSIVRGAAVASVGRDQHDYPRCSVSNAFLRRGYPVFTTHDGTFGYYVGGTARPGWWSPASVSFSNRVED